MIQKKNRTAVKSRAGATRSGKSARRISYASSIVRIMRQLLILSTLVIVTYGSYKSFPYLSPEIKQVVVQGDMVRLDQEMLSTAVYENLRGGILVLDIEYLRTEISKIAWVESVEIVKYYPSTLVVRIVEEKAVARWNDQGYISNAGEFIESALYEDLGNLPLLTSSIGSLAPEQGARTSIELFHRLNSTVLMYSQNIRELRQSVSGGWTMIWDNGLSIDLGRVNHLSRTRHAMAAWQRLPADVKNKIDRIDARYDNGVAIRSQQDQDSQVVAVSQSNS